VTSCFCRVQERHRAFRSSESQLRLSPNGHHLTDLLECNAGFNTITVDDGHLEQATEIRQKWKLMLLNS
jgi:hypothetical protein